MTKTVNGVTESYTYDSGDKLLTAGNKTYTYDEAGRTKTVVGSNGTTFLTYDFESRLTQVSGAPGTHNYTYNGLDTRVSKNVAGQTTSFLRDGAYVTDPVIADSLATYTPGVSERRGGTTRYTHSGLKNTGAQSTNAIVATRVYDAYGMVRSTTGTWSGPFGYAGDYGYQEDETGLRLLGHRYYDASTGRFLTRDPIKDGRNWYSYCDGNPVNGADPGGLSKQWIGYGLILRISQLPAQAQQVILRLLGISAATYHRILKDGRQLVEAADDVVDNVAKKVPNPWGSNGKPDHQQAIQAWIDSMRAQGANIISPQIGRRGPDSFKMADGSLQRPDAVAQLNGQTIALEVGRTIKSGDAVAREVVKMIKLLDSGHFDFVEFVGLKFLRPKR